MKKRGLGKTLSFLLVFCLIFSMFAVSFAEDGAIDDDDILAVEKIIDEELGINPAEPGDNPPGGNLPDIISSDDTVNPYDPAAEVPTDPVNPDPAVVPEDPGRVDIPDGPEYVDNPFRDVHETDYYFKPVMWAVTNDITRGKYYNSFAPDLTCTRAEAITFIWRIMGKPDPKVWKKYFKDLENSQYYYRAVLWAVENGITSGTSETTFSPYEKCTRGQIVTLFFRALTSENIDYSFTDKFIDVPNDAFYAKPVSWAVDNGITQGMGDNIFDPDGYCTRAQIVTFLYRAFASEYRQTTIVPAPVEQVENNVTEPVIN